MPQLDTATFFTQTFWIIFLFLTFYVMALKYVIPNISQSLKARKKKIDSSSEGVSHFQEEEIKVADDYDQVVAQALNESRELMSQTIHSSSNWLQETSRKTNEGDLLAANQEYIKTIGEMSGQKFLIQNCIHRQN